MGIRSTVFILCFAVLCAVAACVGIDNLDVDEDDITIRGTRPCNDRVLSRLQRCSASLQRSVTSSPINCRGVNRALRCLEVTLGRCGDVMGDVVERRMGQLRDQLQHLCPREPEETGPEEVNNKENGGCPSDAATQLAVCAAPMQNMETLMQQGGLSAACGAARGSVQCMQTVADQCPDDRGIQSVVQSSSRSSGQMLDRICPAAGGTSTCPPDYSQQIMTCVTPLQNMQSLVQQGGQQAVCGSVQTAMQCVQDIADLCPDVAEVQPMVDSITGPFQQIMGSMCSSGK